MVRRFVLRAVFAPLVITITTAAVPPAGLDSQLNKWLTETVPATLASVDPDSIREIVDRQLLQTSADIAQLRASLTTQVLETAVHAVRAREEIGTRLSAASSHLSVKTEATLARIDSWMTSMSLTVIAALPGGPGDASASVVYNDQARIVETSPRYTASVPVVGLAPFPTLSVRLEMEEAANDPAGETPALESVAIAPPQPHVEPTRPEVKVANVEKQVLASLSLPEAVAAPAPEAVVAPPAPAPAPALVAPSAPAAVVAPPALTDAAPAPEVKTVRDDKPEEKQVFASLGRQATETAIDAHPVPADKPAAVEAKVAPLPEQPAAFEDRHIDNGGADMPPSDHASSKAISSPLKLRALTRADIPSADKFASLGSAVQSDSRSLPPEQQRVAHDEPVFTEIPVSVGKRKWIDETKYTGLGKPEALLEALRHMGANAKKLGLPPSLWCADFMNLVLRKTGLKATGSRAARSYLEYGTKVDEPRVGAIAILSRGKNNGHIGIVRGTDGNGNPIIISGNHGNKVAEAVYPKHRVLAYVVPR